jgi:hypothetical protein
VRLTCSLAEPDAQHGDGLGGERRGAPLASFAVAAEVRSGGELHVGAAQAGQLAGAQPGLDRDQQQGVVAPAGPGGAVGGIEQRVDLALVEEGDERAVKALRGDREHALDVRGVLGVAVGGEAKQRVDRRQPGVAGAHAVAALVLEVVEEPGDETGVEVADVESAGRLAELALGVGEQQPEGVAVGGDRVWASVTSADEPVAEERLQRRREAPS